ncbi:MAG: hypothetical protein A3D94_19295 [Alphaproteobacteria bacterium RIFCSPHIGHO2_12_FULL_66_14]|nr:MAG: hypothetical protein A3D94_19295 [Alphaproteobacteria bacterium RIFCSPHIGHO2_12_FULL_66_14]
MLDFVGTIATAALTVFVVGALLIFMDISRNAKLALAALFGLWIGVAAAAAASGVMATSQPFPLIGPFVVAPLLAAILAATWPAGRKAMLSLPLTLLIGLNVGRVFALLFLLLAAEGRLSGPFPYSAAWGDIITGVVAVPMLWLARSGGRRTTVLHLWNAFGLADLVVAIGLGVMSAAGSPLQVFPAPGSDAMQHLPWSFVPTVLVPLWMILHAIVWVQLRQQATRAP